jgi:hypothetical protein
MRAARQIQLTFQQELSMLRLRDGQSVLWEALLPPQAKLLSPELVEIDVVLDDDRFLAPFVARLPARSADPRCPSRPTCD